MKHKPVPAPVNLFPEFTLNELIAQPLFWICGGVVLVQIIIYLLLLRRAGALKIADADSCEQDWPGVSVVIAARNEEDNLRAFLPSILEQQYPDFEVIVVDDQSLDHTRFLLQDYCMMYPHLKVVTLDDFVREFEGKKLALMLGFKRASKKILLLTDADCVPASPNWIRHMVAPFQQKGTELVLGVSPYTRKGGLLNKLIQYETAFSALQYISLARAGMPYMGVGRNLAYTKDLFFENKGFAPFLKVISGDDDLFVNQRAHKGNTRVVLHKEAHTFSEPKGTWKEWVSQKTRHVNTGRYYKRKHKLMLSFLWFSHVLFLISIPVAIVGIFPWYIGAALIVLRYAVQLPTLYSFLKKLGRTGLLLFWPILEIIYLLVLLPAFGLSSWLTGKREKW